MQINTGGDIEEVKTVWCVVFNPEDIRDIRKDLSEYVTRAYWHKQSSFKAAKNAGLNGNDAPILEAQAVKIAGQWFTPSGISRPSYDDLKEEKKLELIEEMIILGYTDDDISLLRSGS